MCRNIRTLHNFEPAATEDEIQASALQYVRKISGSTKPSQANPEAFDEAVEEIAEVDARSCSTAGHHGAAEGPRGRGRQGQGALRKTLRRLSLRLARRLQKRQDPPERVESGEAGNHPASS